MMQGASDVQQLCDAVASKDPVQMHQLLQQGVLATGRDAEVMVESCRMPYCAILDVHCMLHNTV